MMSDDAEQRALLKQQLREERRSLPIWSARKALQEQLLSHRVCVVVGETGSGKTTQLPQFLVDALWQPGAKQQAVVAVTQPRRVAATTVAQRVAQERGCRVGGAVGYAVRFDDRTSAHTRIKYLTDGLLLREAVLDPDLKRYSVIVLDEAHERSIATDVLLGLLKLVLQRRSDLRLVVMSATLEAQQFVTYFGDAASVPVVYIEGRQFPVDVHYLATPESDYVDATLLAVLQVHIDLGETDGDILAFLTGQEEIESLERLLLDRSRRLPDGTLRLVPCPLFAAQAPDAQQAAFQPAQPGTRKVILSTNIAETSVTINGVTVVIDCGLVKARMFDPRTGMDALVVVPVSQAQARQRTGRAGREAPGTCFRLFTEADFLALDPATTPEIRRCNLAGVLLQLKALGIDDILGFPFLDKPPKDAMIRSLEQLVALGALAMEDGKLTHDIGHQMAQLPLEPMLARALLASVQHQCTAQVLSIVSMLSVDNLFVTPREREAAAAAARKRFTSPFGDHITLLNVMAGYRACHGERSWCRDHFVNWRVIQQAVRIRQQLVEMCHRLNINVHARADDGDSATIVKCLLAGFFMHVAERQPDGQFITAGTNQQVAVHPSSTMFHKKPRFVMFHEQVQTSRRYLRTVSVVDHTWLVEVAPHIYR